MSVRPNPLAIPTAAILEQNRRLDQAIDTSLDGVVGDTENSALAIIQEVRALHDTASTLVTYLEGSSLKSGELAAEILDSLARLVDIGAFMERLPPKMERDLRGVQSVVREIRELSGLAESVQQISMQSHMLAINAAIQAMHAGDAGAAFRVVAEEMRTLASNSRAAAVQITQGLTRARAVVEQGMAASLAESTQQLGDVSHAAASIRKLQENLEDMSDYYKTRFTVVTKHNEDLKREIAEMLGHIQYQDVVRQAIERIRAAIGRRNASLEAATAAAQRGGPGLAQLPQQLELILHDYLQEEDKHRHSGRASSDADQGSKIELF
jgi:methyl-accepting chemotaxis protein